MTCNEFVYVNGEFAFRTDPEGVEFIRAQLKAACGTAAGMVVRDAYHRDDIFPLGATGQWIRQACESSGTPLFSND